MTNILQFPAHSHDTHTRCYACNASDFKLLQGGAVECSKCGVGMPFEWSFDVAVADSGQIQEEQ